MLAHRAATSSKWAVAHPTAAPRRARVTSVRKPTTIARDGVEFQIPAEGGDISPALAAGFFVAAKQGVVQASVENMRMVMGICILVYVVANVVTRRELHHWDLGALAPAAIAANSMDYLALTPAAIAAFGTLLCTAVEGVVQIKNAYYLLLVSLAAAVYYQVGALWVCTALVVTYGYQFVTRAQDSKIVASAAAITLAACFALVSYAKDKCMTCANEIAISVVIARCGWAAFKICRSLVQSETDN